MNGTNNPTAVSSGTHTFNNVTSSGQTISATFEQNTYTITASADTNGSISPSGTVTVNHGANQTFTITPNSGYQIATVLVNGTNNPTAVSSGTYTFNNVTSNGRTIHATFGQITYSLSGSISTSGDRSDVNGATMRLMNGLTEVASCVISGGSYTLNAPAGTYTYSLTMPDFALAVNSPSAVTVSGNTSQNLSVNAGSTTTWTINASADSNGSISPAGSVIVPNGGSQTFSITPSSGYDIDTVLVNGINNPTAVLSGTYTFTNVTSNGQTISATFAATVIPTEKSQTTTTGCAASYRARESLAWLMVAGLALAMTARLGRFVFVRS